jgi:hypothetical protein
VIASPSSHLYPETRLPPFDRGLGDFQRRFKHGGKEGKKILHPWQILIPGCPTHNQLLY